MKLGSLIASGVKSGFGKLLTGLGVGIVSYGGYQVVLDNMKTWVVGAFNSMPSDMFNIFLMAGGGDALGYIFGAYSYVLTARLMSNFRFGGKK